jgi:hypothetical protein
MGGRADVSTRNMGRGRAAGSVGERLRGTIPSDRGGLLARADSRVMASQQTIDEVMGRQI